MEFKNLNSFYKNNLGKSVEKLLQQKINSYIGNKNNKVISIKEKPKKFI